MVLANVAYESVQDLQRLQVQRERANFVTRSERRVGLVSQLLYVSEDVADPWCIVVPQHVLDSADGLVRGQPRALRSVGEDFYDRAKHLQERLVEQVARQLVVARFQLRPGLVV